MWIRYLLFALLVLLAVLVQRAAGDSVFVNAATVGALILVGVKLLRRPA